MINSFITKIQFTNLHNTQDDGEGQYWKKDMKKNRNNKYRQIANSIAEATSQMVCQVQFTFLTPCKSDQFIQPMPFITNFRLQFINVKFSFIADINLQTKKNH